MNTIGAILTWLVFGLIVGALGRLLVPGRQAMSWLSTIALGVLGSFAGGAISALFNGGNLLQPSSFLMSVIGAVIVLVA
ncbi:MAG: GlsB/YeaQ/YmgE family stress response membrane protein, partial [Planctomycetaceae bacterium]|nr:GlsB/YeaQ/YmgE family stress response membrane protein [Planctomycetaceae bacterium]